VAPFSVAPGSKKKKTTTTTTKQKNTTKQLTFAFILTEFYHDVLKSQLVSRLAFVVPEVGVTKRRHA